jgi:exosortase E/protease (VPEID-CTERM system)
MTVFEGKGRPVLPVVLLKRVAIATAILAVEAFWTQKTGVNPVLRRMGGVVGNIASVTSVLSWLLFPCLLFSVFIFWPKVRLTISEAASPFSGRRAAAHFGSFAAFAGVTLLLAWGRVGGPMGLPTVVVWLTLGAASLATLARTILPAKVLLGLSSALLVGLGVAIAAYMASRYSQDVWQTHSEIAIGAVRWVLERMGFVVKGNVLGTKKFSVYIASSCSGYEGMGLTLAFSIAWLAWFRREYRFPHALLLLPLGVLISWCLNVVRLALLILIGHMGFREIAIGGFHSQAGWMAFTVIAVAFCAVSDRIPGIGISSIRPIVTVRTTPDPATVYVAPFLVVQLAAMLGTAFSGRFEWLYPIRVLAVAAVVWWYRTEYRTIAFPVGGWMLPAALGIACGVGWALVGLRFPHDAGPLAMAGSISAGWRIVWLFFRGIGAVTIAPFAEELAFRGCLMRRVHGADFENVDPRRAFGGLALSSLSFGLLHGHRWIEGTLAGLLYGGVYSKTRRIGGAIVAHVVTNATLLCVIGATSDWRYW